MADFGAPVAANIQAPNPNQGIQTLSGLMGLQQQQQQIQAGAAQAQMAQQTAQQRQGIANIDWSKYDDGSGMISTDKMLGDPSLRAASGDQFMDVMKTGALIRSQQLQNKQSLLTLNNGLRDQLGSIAGALRTDPDVVNDTPAGRQKVSDALSRFGAAGGPDAQRVANIFGPMVEHVPQGSLAQGISTLQLQAMDTSHQSAAQAPSYVNTGGALSNINPQAAGGNLNGSPDVPLTISPSERQTVGVNPLTGGPTVVTKNGQGVVQGITNAPTQGVYVPQPGDKEALPVLSAERDAARQAYTNAGLQHTNNQIVLNNIDNVGATGVAGQGWRNIMSAFGFRAGDATDQATAYDLVGKGLERSALQAAQSMGPQTNAGLAAQVAANGSTHYTPAAIKEITKLNDAITTGAQSYQPGLERAIAANPSAGIFAKRSFDQAWGANFDPRIYQMYNAAKSGDSAEVNSIVSSLGGKNSAQFKALMEKAGNLERLSNTGGLQ